MKRERGESPQVDRRPLPPEVIGEFERFRKTEEDRRAKYGDVRDLVTFDWDGNRFVAVGGTLHWNPKWKTFTDFLLDYIKRVLGRDWGNAELAKAPEDRHPIIQWYGSMCELQRRTKASSEADADGLYSSELDGPSRAYLALAYDLFVLPHNSTLQERLIARLKDARQFQGARYELFVAATMIRAGCDIAFENEDDVSRKHPEFVATFRATGECISVEAKSRHRDGVLGFRGVPAGIGEFRVGLDGLLRKALAKPTSHPFFVFVDANMPPEVASPLSLTDWRQEIMLSLRRVPRTKTPAGIYVPSQFNLLAVTNVADHYGPSGAAVPVVWYYLVTPSQVMHPLKDGRALKAVETALTQYGHVPQDFPKT